MARWVIKAVLVVLLLGATAWGMCILATML